MPLRCFNLSDSALLIVKSQLWAGCGALKPLLRSLGHCSCVTDGFPCCGAEEAGRQWLQGRKLPSLTPASSPHGGITCSSLLGLPSCSALPAVRQLWSEPCRSEIVLKLCFYQCTVASSVETIAALIALLLPHERRRVFGSNKSAEIKAVSALSITFHINKNVAKCFFVLLSIWHFSTSCNHAVGRARHCYICTHIWNENKIWRDVMCTGSVFQRGWSWGNPKQWSLNCPASADYWCRAAGRWSILYMELKLLKLTCASPNPAFDCRIAGTVVKHWNNTSCCALLFFSQLLSEYLVPQFCLLGCQLRSWDLSSVISGGSCSHCKCHF